MFVSSVVNVLYLSGKVLEVKKVLKIRRPMFVSSVVNVLYRSGKVLEVKKVLKLKF